MSLRQYLTGSVDDDDFSELLFSFYLWPEFQDEVVVYLDTLVDPWQLWNEDSDDELEPDFDELEEKFAPISTRMWRWLVESTSRYSTLIRAYNNIKNDLLAKVETIADASGSALQHGNSSVAGSGTDSSSQLAVATNESVGSTQTSSENNSNTSVSGTNSNNTEVLGRGSKSHVEDKAHLDLFNDTPQNAGDFVSDPYVTNARKITDHAEVEDVESNLNSTAESGSNNSSTVVADSASTLGRNNVSTETSTNTTISNTNNSNVETLSNSSNSTTSSSTTATDVTTPIERLDEIRKKLHNLYTDWADEFKQFVIYAD